MEAASIALLQLLEAAQRFESEPEMSKPEKCVNAIGFRKSGMTISLWIEKNSSDVCIKSNNTDLNFCWRYLKQNNPDPKCKKWFPCGAKKYRIVGCKPESISLRTKKGKAHFPLLIHLHEIQSAYEAEIDTIVIDENVLDTRSSADFVLQQLTGVKCKNLTIRGTSTVTDPFKNDVVEKLLEKITVLECLYVQIPITLESEVEGLNKIPHVRMDVRYQYSDIASNSGFNSMFLLETANSVFINHLLMFLAIGTACNITTLRITIKKFVYRNTDQLLRRLTHFNKRGNQDFHDLFMRQQLLLMANDGLDIRRSDGVLITVFVNGELNAEGKTFTIYHAYPWDGELSERMPAVLEAQEENYKKYERLITEENNLEEKQRKRSERLDKRVDEELSRRDMMGPRDTLELKRNLNLEAIEKAKIEVKKQNLERKLENGRFLSSVMCGAAKRKEFGFLSGWPKQQ
ncbi:unnamed protein product [Caenorhabditis brenneri]